MCVFDMFMYVCMYVCVYVFMCVYVYTYLYIYTSVSIGSYTFINFSSYHYYY